MTSIHKAALADVPVLAVAVAVEVDPTKILAWLAAGFFAALAWFVQREWQRHEASHATIDARHEKHDARLRAVEEALRLAAREEKR